VRIGLADDSELFRAAMVGLLTAMGEQVVLQVGSGGELLDRLATVRLDLAILDVRMPPTFTEEGLDTAAELGRRHPGLAVLVVSTYAETAYAVRVFQGGSGRRGYLLKDSLDQPEALRTGLERLRAGGAVLDASIVQRLLAGSRCQDALSRLTDRQRRIVPLLAQGYSDPEIAGALDLDGPAAREDIRTALRTGGIAAEAGVDRVVAVLTWLRSQCRNYSDIDVGEPSAG
jgi:DNA-binding NarL/FixJ family response regulator